MKPSLQLSNFFLCEISFQDITYPHILYLFIHVIPPTCVCSIINMYVAQGFARGNLLNDSGDPLDSTEYRSGQSMSTAGRSTFCGAYSVFSGAHFVLLFLLAFSSSPVQAPLTSAAPLHSSCAWPPLLAAFARLLPSLVHFLMHKHHTNNQNYLVKFVPDIMDKIHHILKA